MQFRLYFVDDHQKNFYEEAKKEYEKRLSRYCKLKIIKIKGSHELEKKLKEEEEIFFVTPGKNLLSSEEFADSIREMELQGKTRISFLIAPSVNVEFLKGKKINPFSISPMDLSEGLLSTVLLEQIYRAYRIIKNEPYHK